jgi:hypothetical protein
MGNFGSERTREFHSWRGIPSVTWPTGVGNFFLSLLSNSQSTKKRDFVCSNLLIVSFPFHNVLPLNEITTSGFGRCRGEIRQLTSSRTRGKISPHGVRNDLKLAKLARAAAAAVCAIGISRRIDFRSTKKSSTRAQEKRTLARGSPFLVVAAAIQHLVQLLLSRLLRAHDVLIHVIIRMMK